MMHHGTLTQSGEQLQTEIRGKETIENKIYQNCRLQFAKESWNTHTCNILDKILPNAARRVIQYQQLLFFFFPPSFSNIYTSQKHPGKEESMLKICRNSPTLFFLTLWATIVQPAFS